MKPLVRNPAKDSAYGPHDTLSLDDSAFPPDLGLGAYLRAARESVRLSPGSVAGSLHVDTWIIEALESEDFSRLPAPVYIKGHLRNYARLLGASEERIFELYRRIGGPDASPVPTQAGAHAEPQLRWGVYLTILGLIVVPFLWFHDWQDDTDPPSRDLVQSLDNRLPLLSPGSSGNDATANAAAPPAQASAIPVPPISSSVPQGEAPHEPEARVTAQAAKEPPPSPSAEASRNEPTPSAEASANGDTVAVQARENAWVSIHDQKGHRLVFETVPAGASRTVRGTAPFSVTLGNAPATSVSFNGQAFDLSGHIVGTGARFKLGNPATPQAPLAQTPGQPAAPDQASPSTEGPSQVSVHAAADTWVSIKDRGGKRLAYETVPAGASRSYSGQAPFAVVLGNAPGARLEFNGQPFNLAPHTVGTRARLTLGK